MTPKEYLKQIERLDTLIKQRRDEQEELEKYDGINGVDYISDRVQTSPSNDVSFIRMIEKIEIIKEQINVQIGEYLELKHKIIGEIQGLPNSIHVRILFEKYVNYKRLEVIAVEMNYSYDYIKHQHGYALQSFGRKHLHQ